MKGETNETYHDFPISLDYHCSIKTNNFVYVIGGSNYNNINKIESSKGFRLNLNEKVLKWKEIALINLRRSAPGVAAFDDTIVMCGGYNGLKHLSSTKLVMPR